MPLSAPAGADKMPPLAANADKAVRCARLMGVSGRTGLDDKNPQIPHSFLHIGFPDSSTGVAGIALSRIGGHAGMSRVD